MQERLIKSSESDFDARHAIQQLPKGRVAAAAACREGCCDCGTRAHHAEKEEQLNERERVIAVRDAELYAKTLQIENLKAQLAILRRSRYGRSSEKLDQE